MKTNDLFLRLPQHARILLLRLRSMGDCLLLTSPVRALKAQFPGFHVTVVVEARFAECYQGNPDFDEVLSIGKKTDALPLLLRRFDLILNLHGGPTSLTFALLSRGPRLGFQQFQYSWIYSELLPSPDPEKHTVEATMDAFRRLGVHAVDPPPLRFERQEKGSGPGAVSGETRPYVVLHPAAVMETKRWDAGKFAQLATVLRGWGFSSVITCGPGEDSMADAVCRAVPGAQVFAGLRIPELAELIRNARLYVGNDSGPMHLAAAVGTPVLALWGSSDSRRWRPWKVRSMVVQNPFECNPCPGYRCLVAPSPLCIESVTVEQAVHAARQLLAIEGESPSESR